MYTKKQRMFAALVCLTVIIATLFSLFYIIHESDHNCMGEKCPVCACIHDAEQNLKQLGTGLVSAIVLIPVLYFAVSALSYTFHDSFNETLTDLKVRLNN